MIKTAAGIPPAPYRSRPGTAPVPRRRRAARILACLLLLPCLVADARAQAEIDTRQSGNLLLRMAAGYRSALRLETGIDMAISGTVARVRVRQMFRNDGGDWAEGVYVFPLPAGAALERLRVRAGERVIEGEIRARERARKAYERARREGRKAGLVGQQRSNLFTTNLANIAPGETVVVEIGYLDRVTFDDGAFGLRFPMTLTPRYIPGLPLPDRQGNGWSADTARVPDASLITPPVVTRSDAHRLTLSATVDAGMPLDIVASRYHPIRVAAADGVYTVTLADDGVKSDHDLELLWRPRVSQRPDLLQFAEVVNGRPHLLLMLMPPSTATAPDAVPPRSLTLVIDTSGSMHGRSLEQARRALGLALDELRPADRFNVLQFNSVTDALFPELVPATSVNLKRARRYLGGLAAEGGTEMRPALQRALGGQAVQGLHQVVFVTDGAVGNETGLFELIEARLGNARLFTVGIGSAPNGYFMRRAAEAGRGRFVLVSALHEVEEKMTRLLGRLRAPELTGIRLAWPGGLRAESYPARVPDLYAGEPVLLTARLERAARPGDRLLVRGNSPQGPWSRTVPLAVDGGHDGVAALWARERIRHLHYRERQAGEPGSAREAITATALDYGLVSKYTSLVAVDRSPERPEQAGLTREQVPNLLPYGQSQGAIFGFPATATLAPRLRLSGSLLLLIAAVALLVRVLTLRMPPR